MGTRPASSRVAGTFTARQEKIIDACRTAAGCQTTASKTRWMHDQGHRVPDDPAYVSDAFLGALRSDVAEMVAIIDGLRGDD